MFTSIKESFVKIYEVMRNAVAIAAGIAGYLFFDKATGEIVGEVAKEKLQEDAPKRFSTWDKFKILVGASTRISFERSLKDNAISFVKGHGITSILSAAIGGVSVLFGVSFVAASMVAFTALTMVPAIMVGLSYFSSYVANKIVSNAAS